MKREDILIEVDLKAGNCSIPYIHINVLLVD